MSSVQIRPPRLILPSRKDNPCAWAFCLGYLIGSRSTLEQQGLIQGFEFTHELAPAKSVPLA